jgi:hypothetical protein
MEWQPIETAPKDGSQFLAYADGAYHVCYHINALIKGVYCPRWFNGEYCISPTHWVQLPAPPTA